MNYIYDIYLNFNDNLIDFFEWNKNDTLTHLKKIPIIKIDDESFKNICSNNFKISMSILSKIKNKTEVWKDKKNIQYCTLFCTDTSIICIIFNNKGISIKRSFLFIDEELEILDNVKNFKMNKIEFKILNKLKASFKTRLQNKKDLFINKNLNDLDYEKLKYIYFECFNKYNNKSKMIFDIKKINKNSIQYENLYNILKFITSIKK